MKIHRERIEWTDAWIESADKNRLPRVLLIGDSIARSYYPHVANLLKNRFSCARFTTSKCVCDPSFTKELLQFMDGYKFDIIHFNNGLHGWNYSEALYAKWLKTTLARIHTRQKKAVIILATTTPVWKDIKKGKLASRTKRVLVRNSSARNIAVTMHLPVNDLFPAVIDHPEYFCADCVHFNPEGQLLIGHVTAGFILKKSTKKNLHNSNTGEE